MTMTDRIDTIIDIATSNDRETARRLIAQELGYNIVVDKARNADIPIQEIGTFTNKDGRTATIYRGPPGSKPDPEMAPEQVRKELNDLNQQSADYLKQFKT